MVGAQVRRIRRVRRAIRRNPGRDQAPELYVSPRERPLTPREAQVREIAIGIKTGEPRAVQAAARAMAPLVSPGSVLVPVPGHLVGPPGPGALALAHEIARLAGAQVYVALVRGRSVLSSRSRRRGGFRGLDPLQHAATMRLVGPVPQGNVILIDNVVVSGATLEGARQALGRDALGLAYARAADIQLPPERKPRKRENPYGDYDAGRYEEHDLVFKEDYLSLGSLRGMLKKELGFNSPADAARWWAAELEWARDPEAIYSTEELRGLERSVLSEGLKRPILLGRLPDGSWEIGGGWHRYAIVLMHGVSPVKVALGTPRVLPNPSDAETRRQGRDWETPEEGMQLAAALRRQGDDRSFDVEAEVADLVYGSHPTWENYVALAGARDDAGLSYYGEGLDDVVNSLVMNGGSEDIGDVQGPNAFSRVSLGPSFAEFAITEAGGGDQPGREPLHPGRFHVDDFRFAMGHAGAIMITDNFGRSWVDYHVTPEEFDAAWQAAEDAVDDFYEDDEEDSPDWFDVSRDPPFDPLGEESEEDWDARQERDDFYGREQNPWWG